MKVYDRLIIRELVEINLNTFGLEYCIDGFSSIFNNFNQFI